MQKVYIIEDEALLRDLVLETLRRQPDLEVIGSSGDGRDGLKQCLELKPDMVILDMVLPGLNGVEVARKLRADLPATKVLVFSGMFNLGTLKRVLMTKANGIVEKSAGLVEMEKAIRQVASGQSYYGPAIIERMPELFSATPNSQGFEGLTAREREVLQLIAEGLTTKEIAGKLGISARTADVHRTHLMQKLDAHNVAGLTRAAISFGLVKIDPSI